MCRTPKPRAKRLNTAVIVQVACEGDGIIPGRLIIETDHDLASSGLRTISMHVEVDGETAMVFTVFMVFMAVFMRCCAL